jgi:superfamily II DNA/RNA helicase
MILNHVSSPRNLIGQSQSGTGKTAAFTLNMLSRVDSSLDTPQVSTTRWGPVVIPRILSLRSPSRSPPPDSCIPDFA